MTTLLGIAGALLGRFVAWLVGAGDPIDEFFDISTWIAAIVGALVILFVASKLGAGRGAGTDAWPDAGGEADRGRSDPALAASGVRPGARPRGTGGPLAGQEAARY